MQRATWVVLLISALISCAKDPWTEPIEPHRALWDAAGISDYEFWIAPTGVARKAPALHIVVRTGLIKSTSVICSPPLTNRECRDLEKKWSARGGANGLSQFAKTIPQLFDEVVQERANASKGRARALIIFDPDYGFPTRFSFDDPRTDDEEFGFQILKFKVWNGDLQPPSIA